MTAVRAKPCAHSGERMHESTINHPSFRSGDWHPELARIRPSAFNPSFPDRLLRKRRMLPHSSSLGESLVRFPSGITWAAVRRLLGEQGEE